MKRNFYLDRYKNYDIFLYKYKIFQSMILLCDNMDMNLEINM